MKVRKIAALAVGAAMVGATVGFASAQASVPNIPKEFFVKDGEPNVKIVVGSQAAAADVASAADIAVALGSLLYTEKEATASGEYVKVKKDTAYDPADIPVFKAVYENATLGTYEDLKDEPYWWNGSYHVYEYKDYLTYKPNFNALLGAWDEDVQGTPTLSIDEINGTVVWPDGRSSDVNPMVFTAEDALYWKLVQPEYYKVNGEVVASFSEGDILDYTVMIKEIQFDKNEWEKLTSEYGVVPPKDIDLVIPAHDVNVTVDFRLGVYPYTYTKKSGVEKTIYLVDDWAGTELRDGAIEGDTIDLFGKQLEIVAINRPNFLGDGETYSVVFGKALGDYYIKTGESKQFGDYTVEVIDIDVNKVKALLKVTGPEGSKIITLDVDNTTSTPDAVTLFGGGIRIQLLDTFIGIEGTTTAQVKVWTDLFGVKDKDTSLVDGWEVHFVTDGNKGGKLKEIWATNIDDLKSPIEIFNMFKVYYESKIYQEKDQDGNLHTGMEAWVKIDPVEPKWSYDEYKVGDEIDDTGYIVDEIKAGTYTKYTIYHPTEPITYLDTEIDLAAVDSNLILVGGPVVNAVTAALADALGIPKDYNGWKEEYGTGKDSGVVIYKEECDKINGYGVVLVAGTDREGTREAAKALMEYLSSLG